MDLVHNSVSIVRHDRGFAAVFLDEMTKMLNVLQDASDPKAWVLAQRVYVRARLVSSSFTHAKTITLRCMSFTTAQCMQCL